MKKVNVEHKENVRKANDRNLRNHMYFNRGRIKILDEIFESLTNKQRLYIVGSECVGRYTYAEKWRGMTHKEKLEALINLISLL